MNDFLHSEFGPVLVNGEQQYWIFGEQVTKEEYFRRMPVRFISDNRTEWRLGGALHRLYGPAVEHSSGEKEYWVYGVRLAEREYFERVPERRVQLGRVQWRRTKDNALHREDGPAHFHEHVGSTMWFVDGKYHREDGPAIVADPNGKPFREHLFEGAREMWHPGDQVWLQHGKLHREGGPAIDCVDGYKDWRIRGQRHREDGPAFEFGTRKEWYLNGDVSNG